ncbi:MAG: alpha/beta hydrolase [Gemmatimonadaceae bacterium]|nr:alpha/beta hydrolase [Gemmatimonadaceae bacterium]
MSTVEKIPRRSRGAERPAWWIIGLVVVLATARTATAQTRLLRAGDIDTMPATRPSTRITYGTDSLHFGELRLPDGRGPFPVAIVIHGGCWLSRYASVRNSAPLADALAASGVATWNIEYRRYDHPGGGWPGTLLDAAHAADHVRALARSYPLDTTRIVAVGHSAGGQLALWLATRGRLAPQSDLATTSTPVPLKGVVSIGGIADLREFYARERATCGNPAVESLLGGAPDSVPARLREASPIERLPLGVPSVHIAGARDFIAPTAVRDAFAEAARQRGDRATVTTVPDEGHFEAIAPRTVTGRAVIDAVRAMLGLPR